LQAPVNGFFWNVHGVQYRKEECHQKAARGGRVAAFSREVPGWGKPMARSVTCRFLLENFHVNQSKFVLLAQAIPHPLAAESAFACNGLGYPQRTTPHPKG